MSCGDPKCRCELNLYIASGRRLAHSLTRWFRQHFHYGELGDSRANDLGRNLKWTQDDGAKVGTGVTETGHGELHSTQIEFCHLRSGYMVYHLALNPPNLLLPVRAPFHCVYHMLGIFINIITVARGH